MSISNHFTSLFHLFPFLLSIYPRSSCFIFLDGPLFCLLCHCFHVIPNFIPFLCFHLLYISTVTWWLKETEHIKSPTINQVIRMQQKVISEKATSIIATVDKQLHKSESSKWCSPWHQTVAYLQISARDQHTIESWLQIYLHRKKKTCSWNYHLYKCDTEWEALLIIWCMQPDGNERRAMHKPKGIGNHRKRTNVARLEKRNPVFLVHSYLVL